MNPSLRALLATTTLVVTVLWIPASGREIRLRTVLHDPLGPHAELHVPIEGGKLEPLNLSLEGLSLPQPVIVSDGRLLLYDSPVIDPEAPLSTLAAAGTIADRVKRAIVFILPAGKKTKLPYRLIIVNDGPGKFPKGSSRMLNLTSMKLRMKVDDQSLNLPSGRIVGLPPVDGLNHMNQAQTTFYREHDGDPSWVPFADRPMQFSHAARNLIIIYQMPGLEQPRLRTIIDTDLR